MSCNICDKITVIAIKWSFCFYKNFIAHFNIILTYNTLKLMITKLLTKVFGSRNQRLVKRMLKTVEQINALEPDLINLTDEQLKNKTVEFRQRLNDGESLDKLLPEAFAVVRETGKRVLGMRHFDMQLVGGIALHQGKIAEMRTGEGKTLVATLAVYLNALPGEGTHIVTVNDYLARRDAEWMGQIYRFLGMTVGVSVPGMNHAEKQLAYQADITYATNNEIGFDYLRDNMVFKSVDRVQRGLYFAVIDEVDSILIDEARTPLIISGSTDDNSSLYKRINLLIPSLVPQERAPHKDDEEEVPGDFYVDEKSKQVILSDEGHQHVEELLIKNEILSSRENLYDSKNIVLMHHVNAALRAHHLFEKNTDYIVKDNQIVIVDEFTGRTMPGRRWSEGLHQALEAKEDVPIQNENQTLASITFQNLFRLYKKLSGMTGTADTEAYEFQSIYNLEVVVIPTNKDMIRKDFGDLVFLTKREKLNAILEDIQDCLQRKQPVLVGTTSIENSEIISRSLQQAKIKHQVLNAKLHEKEAEIIVQAGRPGAVTIATNMAGRGTDIVLGGNVEAEIKTLGEQITNKQAQQMREEWEERHAQVLESGGLHIIGTERHESRRIDNQLRGRSGRQGDPGSSRFYLSLEDSLMRIFASDRVAGLMQKLGMGEGEAIEHPWVTRSIETAQRKVEGRNFDIRKQLLEYDDVANDQRWIIYNRRNDLLELESIAEAIKTKRVEILNETIDQYIPPKSLDELWDIPSLENVIEQSFGSRLPIAQWLQEDENLHEDTLREKILNQLEEVYLQKETQVGSENMRIFEKNIMLQVLDHFWKDHLAAMDHLRQGIHLRGYAQKNPKHEFKREAFEMFTQMLRAVDQRVIEIISKVQFQTQTDAQLLEQQQRQASNIEFQHAEAASLTDETREASENEKADNTQTPFVRPEKKVGRNEPCPCGSGKKYKQCHGQLN